MPRRSLRFSEAASVEYRSIIRESALRFGSDQSKQYRHRIQSALRVIAHNPEVGLSRDELVIGTRRFRVESHFIYYQIQESRILVSHILHHRQSEDLGDWESDE